MEITILLLLIQPILFIWILFKAIKNINKIVLNSNQEKMAMKRGPIFETSDTYTKGRYLTEV